MKEVGATFILQLHYMPVDVFLMVIGVLFAKQKINNSDNFDAVLILG